MAAWLMPWIRRDALRDKRILITGCDTGFGQLMALHFSREGAYVYAGVLSQSNAQSLDGENIFPVVLDVTDAQNFQTAFEFVSSHLKGASLDVIVCNAGIYMGWFVEFTAEEEFHRSMDVNFMGTLRTIQKFLPLLRRPDGRVIGITSVAAFAAFRGISAYTCSKFAQGALLDSLRRELRQIGIRVIQICPGFFKTPIVMSQIEVDRVTARYERTSDDIRSRYGDLCEESRSARNQAAKLAKDPIVVVKTVRRGIVDRWPKSKMLVGWDARIFRWITMLPDYLSDWVLSKEAREFKTRSTDQGLKRE